MVKCFLIKFSLPYLQFALFFMQWQNEEVSMGTFIFIVIKIFSNPMGFISNIKLVLILSSLCGQSGSYLNNSMLLGWGGVYSCITFTKSNAIIKVMSFFFLSQDRQNNYSFQVSCKGYILEGNYCSSKTERLI